MIIAGRMRCRSFELALAVCAMLSFSGVACASEGERPYCGKNEPRNHFPGFAICYSDGHITPIVKVAPEYPKSAMEAGVEGYVLIEFSVREDGTVGDIAVLESYPKDVFEEAALAALIQWQYKPRIVDGQVMAVPGVQEQINFCTDY